MRLTRELISILEVLRPLHFDFATLEQVSGSFIDKKMARRESDVVWRVHTRHGHPVYFLIEFQSTVDRLMPLRIAEYATALCRALHGKARATRGKGSGPLILPIVVYTGDARWTAPKSLAAMTMAVPRALRGLVGGGEYLILDGQLLRTRPRDRTSVFECVIRLEHSRDQSDHGLILEDLISLLNDDPELLQTIHDWLKIHTEDDPEYSEIVAQAFANRGNEMTLSTRIKEFRATAIQMGRVEGLAEGRVEGLAEGRAEGHAEGRAAGLAEGTRNASMRQLEILLTRRFGSRWPTAKRKQAITQADAALIEAWFERAIDAPTARHVFGF
jgi:hypothetical protein